MRCQVIGLGALAYNGSSSCDFLLLEIAAFTNMHEWAIALAHGLQGTSSHNDHKEVYMIDV